MTNILMVASECFPFAKSGGLGDVIGSLPKALHKEGATVRVVLPKYATIPEEYKEKMTLLTSFETQVGWRQQYTGIEILEHEGVVHYFIDNEYYFNRNWLYGHYDEAERFTFFCRAVLEMLKHIDFAPEIIHTHDWQAAMLNVFLKVDSRYHPQLDGLRTLFTIHNLKYQGVFTREILGDILELSDQYFEMLEYHGQINFLKGGLQMADAVSTVSRSYAWEIRTPHFGEGLHGVLESRDYIYGITNGIDYEIFNPEKDKALTIPYTKKNVLAGKKKNKRAFQQKNKLPESNAIPLLAIVSRLVTQKGLDLVEHVIEEITNLNIQLVILGTGDPRYENLFRNLAHRKPNKVVADIYYDETTAHWLYASADMLLMPSEYEPCGLSQLIGMRYGTIPIVRETGGLKDTIEPYNEFTGQGNGFSFRDYNAHDMLHTIQRALGFYGGEHWKKIVVNAMEKDYSWRKAAKEYIKLYETLRDGRSYV